MDWIPTVVEGSAATILLAAVWAIFTGRLIPKSMVDSLREIDRTTIDRQQQEIAEWRQAWIVESQTKRELASQVGELMKPAQITGEILRTISEDAGS